MSRILQLKQEYRPSQMTAQKYPGLLKAEGKAIRCIPCGLVTKYRTDHLYEHLLCNRHKVNTQVWNLKHPDQQIPDYTEEIETHYIPKIVNYSDIFIKDESNILGKMFCKYCLVFLVPSQHNLNRHCATPKHIKCQKCFENISKEKEQVPLPCFENNYEVPKLLEPILWSIPPPIYIVPKDEQIIDDLIHQGFGFSDFEMYPSEP